jgi:hypothetical protein
MPDDKPSEGGPHDHTWIKNAFMATVETFCLALAGFGVGWLLGMSTTANVHGVITAILGVVSSVVAVLSGLKLSKGSAKPTSNSPKSYFPELTAIPLGILMLGIVGGSSIGILSRENNLLGFQPTWFVQRWHAVPEAEQKVFLEAVLKGVNSEQTKQWLTGARLFDLTEGACETLRGNITGETLRHRLAGLQDERINRALKHCRTDDDLLIIKAYLCGDN